MAKNAKSKSWKLNAHKIQVNYSSNVLCYHQQPTYTTAP